MGDKTKAQLKDELHLAYNDLDCRDSAIAALKAGKAKLERDLARQQAIVRLLADRLERSETRLIALRVVHGDLTPDQYETSRMAAKKAIEQLLAALNQQQDTPQPDQAS